MTPTPSTLAGHTDIVIGHENGATRRSAEAIDPVIDEAPDDLDRAIGEGSGIASGARGNSHGAAPWDKRTFARNRPRTTPRGRQDDAASRRQRPVVPTPGVQGAITALGYVRVSTDEQSASGAGLAAQRAAIEAEAARRGWELLDVVEDAGFSGRDLRRPGIKAVLQDLHSGRAAALIVAKVDRLSRSMVDFAALMDRSAREGWALVALDLGVDTSTPSGEAMAHVMATFSQLERRMIGQRTKEALAVKRAQGVRLGRPPVLSAAIVERMRQERAAGATLQAIADGLDRDGVPTAQGGRCWHAATVRDVLRSPAHRTATRTSRVVRIRRSDDRSGRGPSIEADDRCASGTGTPWVAAWASLACAPPAGAAPSRSSGTCPACRPCRAAAARDARSTGSRMRSGSTSSSNRLMNAALAGLVVSRAS